MKKYTVKLYHMGELVKTKENLTHQQVYRIYNLYSPFTAMCVDVYENGKRIKFGQTIAMFADRSVPM